MLVANAPGAPASRIAPTTAPTMTLRRSVIGTTKPLPGSRRPWRALQHTAREVGRGRRGSAGARHPQIHGRRGAGTRQQGRCHHPPEGARMTEPDDRILDKVRKLLAKAEHPSTPPAEAEAMSEKAAELMARHAI